MKKSLKKFITTAGLGLSLITPSFSQNTEKIISKTQDTLTQVLEYDTTKHQEIINTPVEQLDELTIQKAMLWEINKIRIDSGLVPLKINPLLNQSAQKYAQYIYDNQWLKHIDKNSKDVDFRIKNTGFKGKIFGENLASGPNNLKKVYNGWMNSMHHKENILDKDYTDIGFGFFIDKKISYKKYKIIRVQNFGGYKDEE